MPFFLDACLTGLGGVCGKEVYQASISENFKSENIAILEMLNILIALCLWAVKWKDQFVYTWCDNEAVVTVLNPGRTKDGTLGAFSRNTHLTSIMYCAFSDIKFKFLMCQVKIM